LYGLDPSRELWHLARERVGVVPFAVEYLGCSAEHIPMGDQSFDTVLITWTLCSIPNPLQALREMRRVLKHDGQLIFIEHGLSPDPRVRVWQHRLNPLWRRIAGGCHLNRPIDTLIETANFRISRIDRGYVRGGKLFSFLYKGVVQAA
jgi:ubiquinone/menaquinone biosynthesis C-methylase UbiE